MSTMKGQILIALVLTLASRIEVLSFTVGVPASSVASRWLPSVGVPSSQQSTCYRLFAAEEGAANDQAEEHKSEEEANNDDETKAKEDKADSSSTDILNSPAFLKRKLEVLKKDIAAADKELAEVRAKMDEAKAEWEPQFEKLDMEYKTMQGRLKTQNEQRGTVATIEIAKVMIDVLDNFDRAFQSVTPSTDEESAIEAEYKGAYNSILTKLSELGVEEIETVGQEFDFAYMQAVMQMPSDEYEEGIVSQEYQKGFKMGETLIRPAMVVVTV